MSKTRLAWLAALAVAIAAALTWALWPDPVRVEMATIARAPLEVTVAAEGVTRVRQPHLVTAPLTGHATRSPVDVGDPVVQGETVVAVIQPAEPAFLDTRARAQAEAAVIEAEAAVRMAAAGVNRAQTELDHARAQLDRNRTLAARGTIPQRMLEDSEQAVTTMMAALDSAQSELALREASLARARAQLLGPESRASEPVAGACCSEILAPVTGTVLALENSSARLVQAGAPLLTIGDLADLEIEVDLLSADAVGLVPGARTHVERWGGEDVLQARVRRIDPRGFTRVSALGIEEQRVRVKLDFVTPEHERPGLGDAFRVFVRIVVHEAPDALQVPVGALFRQGGDWAVYRVEDGRARLARVEIGARTQLMAEVRAGLAEGDRVVMFPGDRIAEGAAVEERALR